MAVILFVLLCFVVFYQRSLKCIDNERVVANIRSEPCESDFRKLFEAPSDTFQQFVGNSEDRRRRVVLRRLVTLRVVTCAWCIILAIACCIFFSGCTTTRNLSNTYNVQLDTIKYKFNFEHSESITSKKE